MSQTRLHGKCFLALMYISICIYCLPTTTWALSDKRLCADPKCEKIISMGKSTLTYRAPEEGLVSFQINTQMRVLSKSAGSDMSLWGVEVNGRRGYVNKKFIREDKIYVRDGDLKFEVPVTLPGQKLTPETAKEAGATPVTVKPIEEQAVLNASEIIAKTDSQDDMTSTTTSPLEVNTNSDQPIINTNVSEENVVQPVQTTPVKQKVEIVDGTEIPFEELVKNDGTEMTDKDQLYQNKLNDIETGELDDDDDEDFDYEEDETEIDNDTIDSLNDNATKLEPASTSDAHAKTQTINAESRSVNKGELHDDKLKDGNQEHKNDVKVPVKEKILQVGEEKINNTAESVRDVNVMLKQANNESLIGEATTEKATETIVSIAGLSAEENRKTMGETQSIRNAQPEGFVEDLSQEAENKDIIAAKVADFNKELIKQSDQAPPTASLKETPNADTTNQTGEKSIESTTSAATPMVETVPKAEENKIESTTSAATLKVETVPKAEENKIESTTSAATANVGTMKETGETIESTAPTAKENVETIAHPAGQNIETLSQTDEKSTTESATKTATGTDSEYSSSNVSETSPESQISSQSIENNTDKPNEATARSLKMELSNNINQSVTELTAAETDNTNESNDAFTSPEEANLNEDKINEAEQHQTPRQPIDQQQQSADQLLVEKTSVPGALPISSVTPLFRAKQLDSNIANGLDTQQEEKRTEDSQDNNIDQAVTIETVTKQEITPEDNQNNSNENIASPSPEFAYTTPSYDSSISANLNERDNPTPEPALDQNHSDNNPDFDETFYANNEAIDNVGIGSVESVDVVKTHENDPIVMQSTTPPASSIEPLKDDDGLFATILGTVNSFLSNNKKERTFREDYDEKEELNQILYPERTISKQTPEDSDSPTCIRQPANAEQSPISFDNFIEVLAAKVLDNSQLLLCLTVAAASSLFFVFGYYCFCNSSNEGALLAKLNQLERSLLAAHKENSLLKHDLMATRTKLSSIEDNSFGSNDMVISLKKQLEEELLEKAKLQEQVKSLEKDLVSAADAGLELNKYVTELLANQNGDESIKDTIEELQRQLNEQDHTIREINASLAEKSRENSELQLSLAEQNARLTSDLSILQQDNDELETEKASLQTRIELLTAEFEHNLNKALEGKNYEIQRLQNHILDINAKWEKEHNELQTSLAKIEALEDCLKTLKKDSSTNMDDLINTAKLRGELSVVQKKYVNLKGQLNSELESKTLTKNQLKSISDEIEKLKKDFNQSEKEKLDAQTRLEVLSNYFKEKEAQLQKELNVKEAMWLKQQGENTGTVDKITGMQTEIQTLKSQNEELRAEIEAQLASHKAQTGILQNRVHEHYLSARQAERRYDEARNEAAVLRSRLTTLASGNAGDQASNANGNEPQNKTTDNKNAPSPLPGSPFFPPPLPFLPPQAFLGSPAAHFMGLPPPPPFLPPPPEDLRPAPLGRMRSPTTLSGRYSPSDSRRSGRYSPRDDYSDYDDDYYDDDYDDRLPSHRRRRSWQRDQYSPGPRTYRSLSPTESRYNGADTETDFSPPASPRSDRAPKRPINEV